jgi:hypothetical protein
MRDRIRRPDQPSSAGPAQGDATRRSSTSVREMVDELERPPPRAANRSASSPAASSSRPPTDQVPVLLGTATDKVLPAYGLAIVYGKGAAGKTTLTMTAVAALAVSDPVARHPRPRTSPDPDARKRRPQGAVRREDPTLRRPVGRPRLPPATSSSTRSRGGGSRSPTAACATTSSPSPATSRSTSSSPARSAASASSGPGAPAETDAFMDLLKEAGLGTELAWWIVHHVNKAGQVSGDFDRHPDTLIRYAYEGKRRNRLTWEKSGGATKAANHSLLEWLDTGVGYTHHRHHPVPDVDWAELERRILDAIRRTPRLHPERRPYEITGGKKTHLGERSNDSSTVARSKTAAAGKKGAPRRLPPRRRPPTDPRRPVPGLSRDTERSSNGGSTGSRPGSRTPGNRSTPATKPNVADRSRG